MAYDGRIAAWMAAWDLTQQAAQLRADLTADGRQPPEFPQLYWAALAEAQIYARLATANEVTGFTAGEVLGERAAEQQAAQRRKEDVEQELLNEAAQDLDELFETPPRGTVRKE